MDNLTPILYTKFLDSLPDAVFVLDNEHLIIAWNAAMERITGISREQALGKGNRFYSLPFFGEPCAMLVDLVLDPDLEKDYQRAYHKKDQNYYGEGVISVKTRENEIYYWSQASPIFDQAGNLIAALEILRDNSPMKALDNDGQLAHQQADAAFQQLLAVEEELRQQYEELQHTERELRKQLNYTNTMVDNLNELFYTFDQDMRLTFINKKSFETLGYRPEELIGTIRTAEIFREEDWKWIEKEIKDRLSSGETSSYVMPIYHRDGSKKYFKINSALLMEEGRIVGGMVLADDITDDIKATEALRESECNLRRITDNMSDLVSELDRHGNVVFASPSHYKVLGYTGERMMTIKLSDFVHPEDLSGVLDTLKNDMDRVKAGISRHRCQHADGHYIWIETVGNPVLQDGKVSGVILSSRDITDRKELEQELRYLSIHDTLTSLYNRTYFEEEMTRLEGGRYNPVGMMIFDLDGLKLVNDTLGHEAGDRLLTITAEILRKCFRTGDVVSRVGGDEYAVLLPETNHQVLEKAASRIQSMIEEYNQINPALPLSVSVGMAVRKDNHSSMRDAYKEADNRMYRIKLQRSASAHSAVVNTLLKALQARDYMTEGHGERMKNLVVTLGKKLGMATSTLANLQLLAQFHDIGKVGIPDRILFKADGLTAAEYREMQRHSEIGQRIALASPEMSSLADLILKHHEWWDGQGYPFGLAGEQIPLECRIIALADAYDTMTHDRPYRQAIAPQEALAEIKRCCGTQFDPHLTELFLGLLGYTE
jgi:diguanylate cyclase (GGDEF)-like protein/PAS domain S-box-containing protein